MSSPASLNFAFLAIHDPQLVKAAGAAERLFAEAFRGELVPQDPSDEPASLMLERLAQERAASEASAPKRGSRKPSAADPAAKKSTPSKSKKVH